MIIDDTLLMKYMRGLCTDKEIDEISRWLEESDENRKAFRDAHFIFECILMTADPKILASPVIRKDRMRTGRVWKYTAAVMAAAAVLAITVFITGHYSFKAMSEEMLVVEVPAGKMMTFTLGDGTEISLNSGSRLVYPPVFYGRTRHVEIDGEARFNVAHNQEHPFVVNTFAADITVLGTEFNVHADREGNIFSTSLLEGKIQVSDASGSGKDYILTPDQTIILKEGDFIIENRLDSQALYWPEGLINIADTDFLSLMSRLETAFGVEIVVERSDIPEIDCTSGEIRVSEGLDNALRVLQHVAEFEYVKSPSAKKVYIR